MSTDTVDGTRSGRRWLRIAIYGSLALFVVWIGVMIYLSAWKSYRTTGPSENSELYLAVRQSFMAELEAKRIDSAYALMSPDYRDRVSREEFENRARKYLEFRARPEVRGTAGESSGPAGGDVGGSNRMDMAHTLQDADENRIRVTTSVRFEDSIFSFTPPPPRMDDFTVEDLPAVSPRNP